MSILTIMALGLLVAVAAAWVQGFRLHRELTRAAQRKRPTAPHTPEERER